MGHPWWKQTVCYQVWPASFKDSNGDGIGDIPGIISKLDHIKSLGVSTIWVSPFYSSPQADLGYDISDYENVYPPYGTLEDVDDLIKEIHDRDMRVIFDLVINHTSEEHAWFKESKKSKTSPRSDWFIWRDSKIVDGKKTAPNNWGAMFGGPAWTYVEERDQWYLALFTPQQPDLNWESPQAREAIYDSAIRFWLKKGVDGFRCDVANLYSKDQRFLDVPVVHPKKPYPFPGKYVLNGPRIHEYWKEIRREAFKGYPDVMLVGEMGGTPLDEIIKYVKGDKEVSMMFDFELFALGRNMGKPLHENEPWDLPSFKKAVMKTQGLIKTGTPDEEEAWVSVWLENHDSPRALSRYGTEAPEHREMAAKLLAMLSCTCSGTVFMYQGQEIGMFNIPDDWSPKDLKDVSAKNYLAEVEQQYPGDKKMRHKAWEAVRWLGRDNARTPVQWSADEHAGFTTGKPWMRVHDSYRDVNVENQKSEMYSPMKFWQQMIEMRANNSSLFTHGTTEMLDMSNPKTMSYSKRDVDGSHALVILNMSNDEINASVLSHFDVNSLRLLASTAAQPHERLAPWEGRVYLIG